MFQPLSIRKLLLTLYPNQFSTHQQQQQPRLMPEDSEDDAFSEPGTPSLDGVQSDEYCTEDGAMSLSPPPSPSMSLHSLGMTPLSPLRHSSVLHRTAKPQHSAAVDQGSSQQDLSQDSRDVLVQRLNDLVSRLSADGGLLGDGIANLHARVDEMEHILCHNSNPQQQKWHQQNLSSVESSSVGGDGVSMLSGLPSPAQPKSSSADAPSSDARTEALPPQQQSRQSEPEEARPQRRRSHFGNPSDQARKVLRDAEKLSEAMKGVIKNLKARQEEQDVIRRPQSFFFYRVANLAPLAHPFLVDHQGRTSGSEDHLP